MASTDDLIRVYERRLAEFVARLAAIERGAPSANSAPMGRARTASGYRLGVDVGGTFTDLLLLDERKSRAFMAFSVSTSSAPTLSCRTCSMAADSSSLCRSRSSCASDRRWISASKGQGRMRW